MKKRKSGLYYFLHNRNGVIGLCGVLLIVFIGLIGPLLIPKPEGYTTDILQGPSAAHWLGTDSLGLDIFAQLVWGANAVITSPNPWWWWLMPSLCIVVYVVCFNLFGTALNDTLNPKGR